MFKIRVAAVLAACLLAGLLLAGCLGGAGRGDAPRREEKLVVCSPHPATLIKPLVSAFEKESGIKVEVIQGGTGQLLQRLEAEGDAPSCDVLWGGNADYLQSYRHLFADYCSANEAAMRPEFKHDGPFNWFSEVPSVIMVNTNLTRDIPVEGYGDLLDPRLRGKVAYADPEQSSAAYMHLVNMLYAMGGGDPEAGWPYAEALCGNLAGQLLPSSHDVYQSVAEGNNAAGLIFEEAAAKCLADGAPVRIVYMREGVLSEPDGICILKNAKHEEYAKKFVDYMTSWDAQKLLTRRLHRRSVRTDVGQPENLLPRAEVKFIKTDDKAASAGMTAWVERFHALSRGTGQ